MNMKQLLLICAVVALVGCGEKKEDGNTGASIKDIFPATDPKYGSTLLVETTRMKAAKRAFEKKRYEEAIKLYEAERKKEEERDLKNWSQLAEIYNRLELALDKLGHLEAAGEYTDLVLLYYATGKTAKLKNDFIKGKNDGMELGDKYWEGSGVPQNIPLAYVLFRIAAHDGKNWTAKKRVALCAPDMNPVDLERAQQLFEEVLQRHPKLREINRYD